MGGHLPNHYAVDVFGKEGIKRLCLMPNAGPNAGDAIREAVYGKYPDTEYYSVVPMDNHELFKLRKDEFYGAMVGAMVGALYTDTILKVQAAQEQEI